MKKSSLYTFILILILSLATVFSPIVPTTKTLAQTLVPLDNTNQNAGNTTSEVSGNNGPGATAAANEANANQASAPQDPTASAKCFTFIPPGVNWDACAAGVMNLIMWVVSWILFIAGLIFDASMYFTIHLSDLINGNPGVPIVTIGWTIFRDLANIFFIFILLWIAISTILGLNSGKTKELLAHLIIVALLINFSLFITEAVIDASNIVAIHFYNLVPGSYSGAFMDGLKIQTLYDSSALNSNISAGSRVTSAIAGAAVAGPGGALIGLLSTGGNPATMLKIVFMGIFGSVLMITAAYVFFTAAILFIIRIVVLMFVMILSPLAFLAYILPSTEHYAEQWKDALIKQSFFAPIYLALSYVVVRTIQSAPFQSVMTVTSSKEGWLNVLTASNQFMPFISIAVNFLLLIGLMLGCILVAKKMEAYGVETATEIGKSARGFVYRQIVRGTYITPIAGAANAVGLGRVAGVVGSQLQKIPGLKKLGAGLSASAEVIRTKEGREELQKKLDINEWNKSFEKSKFGRTEIGAFIRERTTGGKLFGTEAKFGAEKSVKEAYEESERLRERREDLKNADLATKAMKSVKTAEQNAEPYEKPDVKDFTDKDGKFDINRFLEAMQKFLEMYKPERTDYAAGPAGDVEFDTASKLYELRVKIAPKRSDTKYAAGLAGDEIFASDLEKYSKDNFEKPSAALYPGASLPIMKKIADARDARKIKIEGVVTEAKGNLGTTMNFLSPTGFAELDEHEIKELAPYANVSQIEALLKSTEWTMDEKKKMLTQYDKMITVATKFQAEVDAYDKKMDIVKAEIGKGNIVLGADKEIDKSQISVGPDGKRYVTPAKGSGPKLELPEDPEMPSTLRNWARNDVTLRGYEIMASIRPEALKIKALVQVIRWGMTHKDLRNNNNIAFKTREDMTYLKDYKLWRLFKGNEHYMEENTEEERVKAYKKATLAAEAARKAAKAGEEEADARKAWDQTLATELPKDALRFAWLESWLSDRAPNEVAGARGRFRNSTTLHSGVGQTELSYWKGKDNSDIQQMEADLIAAYIKDLEGVAEMTSHNKGALNWMMTNRAGKELSRLPLFGKLVDEQGYEGGKIEIKDTAGKVVKTVSLDEVLKDLDRKVKEGDRMVFASDLRRAGLDASKVTVGSVM